MQADADVSNRLETCLREERAQASQDRQNLLTQITGLITESGQTQDARWTSKIGAVRADIASSKTKFRSVGNSYGEAMDAWSQKETLLVEEVLKSRDSLKIKMKEDWRAINEHNNTIQTTTKSVHEETIRIVDAQMEDMAKQMQALDDYVTRARSQNERHHLTHVTSLQGLASNVRQSYASVDDHFVCTHDRVREIGTFISTQSAAVQVSLIPLDSTIKQPLAKLRSEITGAPLKEYVPTGETPRKIQYQYPTTLPRTASHEKLLGREAPKPSNTNPSPNKSPNKALIYTDAPDASMHPPSTSPSKDSDNARLREISLNVKPALDRATSDSGAGALTSKPDIDGVGMGPPPLKRQATESKLPQKLGGGKGVVKLEGRENVGAGRRLRSSPTN